MDRGRVGEDRGSKETDGCPLTGGNNRDNGSSNSKDGGGGNSNDSGGQNGNDSGRGTVMTAVDGTDS
jgi:hypothetical protein